MKINIKKRYFFPLYVARDFFISLLFPKICVGCEKCGFWLCQKCLEKIKLIQTDICIFCGKISKNGKLCPNCRAKNTLTGVLVASKFSGTIKKAIYSFKYDSNQDLSPILGEILIKKFEKANFPQNYILSSVPLHHKKENSRGFNQSELLAKFIAKETNYKYKNLLKRTRFTQSQSTLSGKKRRENLKGAFRCCDFGVVGQKIIIVDDVCTTGSTLKECAIELRKHGAKEVWGLVLAHGN